MFFFHLLPAKTTKTTNLPHTLAATITLPVSFEIVGRRNWKIPPFNTRPNDHHMCPQFFSMALPHLDIRQSQSSLTVNFHEMHHCQQLRQACTVFDLNLFSAIVILIIPHSGGLIPDQSCRWVNLWFRVKPHSILANAGPGGQRSLALGLWRRRA